MASRATGRIFIALAVLGACVLLVLGFFAIWGRPRSRDRADGGDPDDPAVENGRRSGRRDDFLQQAEEAARAGRYRDALRLLYVSLLRKLDRAQIIRLVKHKTNWDYRREIETNRRDLSGIFGPFTEMYEVKWYGREECDAQQFQAARALYQAAREVAR